MTSLFEIYNTSYQLYLNSISMRTVITNYMDEIMNLYSYQVGIFIIYGNNNKKQIISTNCNLINIEFDEWEKFNQYKSSYNIVIETICFGKVNGIILLKNKITSFVPSLLKDDEIDIVKFSNLSGMLVFFFSQRKDDPIDLDQNELLAYNFATQFLNTTSDGVIITDSCFSIKVVNKMSKNMLNATTTQELISRDILQVIPDLKEKIIGSNPNKSLEILLEKDDDIIIVDIEVKNLSFQKNEYYLFVLKDITEKEINHKKDVIKKKNDFIAFLSHELRNPLQSILMSTKMLEIYISREENKNIKLSKYIDNIKKSSFDMKKIINDVLDLGKIDSGELKINFESLQIKDLVKDIYNNYIDIAKDKGLKLEYYINTQCRDMYSDYMRLQQVLKNLLSNAIKYSNEGTIIIKVVDKEDKILFSIKDQGMGIKEDDMTKLFKQYSQLDHNVDMTIKENSTGLGLIISQKIVKALGSVLQVTSEYGKGSEFSFWLHVNKKLRRNTSECSLCTEHKEIVPIKGNILLVEDHINNLELLKEIIESFNLQYNFDITIDTATSGLSAVQMCNKRQLEDLKGYDLILMDINMEKMDGCQACRIIKKRYGENKIIALTGNIYAHQENSKIISNSRFKCFDDVILKPYTDKKILDILIDNLNKIAINDSIEELTI